MRLTGIDTSRSYNTEANLLKALTVLKVPAEWRYIIVRKIDGRYTAVFQGHSMGSDVAGMAREGFFTM